MVALFLRIYDWFAGRRGWLGAILAAVTLLLLAGTLSLGRNENILDFLPVDNAHRKALNLYQRLSASDRIIAIVTPRDSTAEVDPERLVGTVDRFARAVAECDSLHVVRDLTTRIDYRQFAAVQEFLYTRIPYFLTEQDYDRIDSLLSPQYVGEQIARDRMMLMFPTGGLLARHLQQDPLNLFSPVVSRLQQFAGSLNYELYDGYILSPDRRRAIVLMRTPYGSNETENNARLIDLLEQAAKIALDEGEAGEEETAGTGSDAVGSGGVASGTAGDGTETVGVAAGTVGGGTETVGAAAVGMTVGDGSEMAEAGRKGPGIGTKAGGTGTGNGVEDESCEAELEIHLAGAPVIAVSNARQIKRDSLRAIIIAAVLILALLIATLRSGRALLLIAASILFGWLFAMGALSLFRNEVSMIIIGIASIIIGIAVNYPLHLLAHLDHVPNVRTALREVVSPLVIGNITTVGAFLCLVPMTAPALRDLGLFAAFMLVGTILFVLLFLPHLVGRRPLRPAHSRRARREGIIARMSFENRPRILLVVAVLTLLFGYFSRNTAFDSNMQHINYMTPQQRADLEAFRRMAGDDGRTTVYVASEGTGWDEALQRSEAARRRIAEVVDGDSTVRWRSASPYLPSRQEQMRRLARWERFVAEHGAMIREEMAKALSANGFRDGAFAGFDRLLGERFEPMAWEEFEPLSGELLSGYLSRDGGLCTVVEQLDVPARDVARIEAELQQRQAGSYCFDIRGVNATISQALTGDFNYICWACGVIVFLFLWCSFGRIELSLMAFLPMTVSWLWILGIMEIADIRFNIVNIILATFIFGQGDDYTIFITEGLIYEHAYGRRLISAYKKSIVISALIMLIGIGTLIFSRHPALLSLAEVTIVGMFAVVLMAYILPPFIYRWLVQRSDGAPRRDPVTFGRILATGWMYGVLAAARIRLSVVRMAVGGARRPKSRLRMARALHGTARRVIGLLPGVRLRNLSQRDCEAVEAASETGPDPVEICSVKSRDNAWHSGNGRNDISQSCGNGRNNESKTILNKTPSGEGLVLAGHYRSTIDPLIVAAALPGVVIVTDRKIPRGIARLLRMAGALAPCAEARQLIASGRRILLFTDEGVDPQAEIIPVAIHGSRDLFPDDGRLIAPGCVTLACGPAVRTSMAGIEGYVDRLEEALFRTQADTAYFRRQVAVRYRYKGPEVERSMRRTLRRYGCFSRWIDTGRSPETAVIVNNGQGEFALLYALVHPETKVYAFERDTDQLALARHLADLPANLHLAPESELIAERFAGAEWYLVAPDDGQRARYARMPALGVEIL